MAKTSTRGINKGPAVVKKPTGRSGGTNTPVTAVKKATPYKGSISAAPKGATPGKSMKKSNMSKGK